MAIGQDSNSGRFKKGSGRGPAGNEAVRSLAEGEMLRDLAQGEMLRDLAEGETLRGLDWIALVVRPLIVSAMMACVAAGVVVLVQAIIPAWRGAYVVVMVALMGLITVVSEQRLRHVLDSSERTAVRVAEIVLVLVLLRIAMYVGRGWAALSRDVRIWLGNPGALILDVEFAVLVASLLGFRMIAANIATILLELEVPQDTRGVHSGPFEAMGPGYLKSPLEYLYERFTWGALALMAAVGVLQLDLSGPLVRLRPAQMGPLTWLPLAYVGLGLLLFGQARYALLVADWQRQGIPIASEVRARWARWGMLFVAGVSLAALLLPAFGTEAGFYLVVWLSFVLTVVGQVLMFLLQLLFYPITWLLSTLLSQDAQPIPPQPVAPQLPPPPPPSQLHLPSWFTYLQLSVFWAVALAVLLLVVRRYLRYQQATGQWGNVLGRVRQWLANLWYGLLRQWKAVHTRVVARTRTQKGEPGPDGAQVTPRWRSLWRAATTRERVRQLYLRLLQHAAKAGHPRSPAQTPYEYAVRLGPHVCDEQEALEGLTQAFVEARYSKRDFRQQEMGSLRGLLSRLRGALRRLT